jgi:hypothetical protein
MKPVTVFVTPEPKSNLISLELADAVNTATSTELLAKAPSMMLPIVPDDMVAVVVVVMIDVLSPQTKLSLLASPAANQQAFVELAA